MKHINDRSKIFNSTEKFQKPILDKFKYYIDKTSFLNSNVNYTVSINNPDFKKKLNNVKIKITQAEVLIESSKNEIKNLNQNEIELKNEMMACMKYNLSIQERFTNSSLFFSVKTILVIVIIVVISFLVLSIKSFN